MTHISNSTQFSSAFSALTLTLILSFVFLLCIKFTHVIYCQYRTLFDYYIFPVICVFMTAILYNFRLLLRVFVLLSYAIKQFGFAQLLGIHWSVDYLQTHIRDIKMTISIILHTIPGLTYQNWIHRRAGRHIHFVNFNLFNSEIY